MDSSRLRRGEVVAGIGGLALFVFLFFDWFGGGAELTGAPGNLSLSRPGISGWDALTDLPGFLIILAGVSGIALACLAAAGQRLNIPLRRGAVTASLGTLAVGLILWRMVAGSPTLKIGIFLGLAAAIAIAVGALMALAEDGFKVLVAVPDGRTRTAAASAPPATPSAPAAAVESPATTTRSSSSASTATKKSSSAATTKRTAAKKKSAPGSTRKKSTSKKSSARSRSSGSKTSSTKSRSKSSSSKSRSSPRAKSSRSKSSGGSKRTSSGKKK